MAISVSRLAIACGPDEHVNLHRNYLAHNEVHCTSDLLGLCRVQRPELFSMVACSAADLALDVVGFELFHVMVWRVAKNRLTRELWSTPHIVVVPDPATRSQMLPVGVDQHTGTRW